MSNTTLLTVEDVLGLPKGTLVHRPSNRPLPIDASDAEWAIGLLYRHGSPELRAEACSCATQAELLVLVHEELNTFSHRGEYRSE